MADTQKSESRKRKSEKPIVVEYIFNQRWNRATATLGDPVVTLKDVTAAIETTGADLSTRNPANFFKDFVRVHGRAKANFPPSIAARGYTAKQTAGGGRCFTFIPLAEAEETFAAPIQPTKDDLDHPHGIESVSLPIASRRLGRAEEAWIAQAVVKLRIVETHFALYSEVKPIQVDHLQNSVKLRGAEVDALFLAQQGDPKTGAVTQEILVCCEVKGMRDDILESQILNQLKNLALDSKIRQDAIVAIALKTLNIPNRCLVQVVEFGAVLKSEMAELKDLRIASQKVYEITPSVPGLSKVTKIRMKE